MARKQNTYTAHVKEITSLGEWTENGTGLSSTAVEGETPSETNNVTVAKNTKTLTGLFTLPTLAAGEIVIKAQMFIYAKAGGSGACLTYNQVQGSASVEGTSAAWHSYTQTYGTSVLSSLETFEIKSAKATGGTVYACYLRITTETERSFGESPLKAAFNSTASAGGVAELEMGPSMSTVVGHTAMLFLATVGAGASGITDAGGNTWTKVSEATRVGLAVQVWVCNVTTAIKEKEKLTVAGLTALAKTQVVLGSWGNGLAGGIDVSVSTEATGKEVSATTAATRNQGDVLMVVAATLGESISTATGYQSPGPWSLKSTGLSMCPGFAQTPTEVPESSAITAKAAFSENTAEVAGIILVIAYKVLASGGSIVEGKATGAIVLTGTAKGILQAIVQGKATGALLLTGASTGIIRSVITAKATGTLQLTGVSTGVPRAVVTGKATGALLLTGRATAAAGSVIMAKGTGALLLTGVSKATIASNIVGQATGTLLLTGSGRAFKPSTTTRRSLILIFDE